MIDVKLSHLYHCGVSPRPPTVLITPDDREAPIRTGPSTAIPTKFWAFVDDPAQPFTLEIKVVTRGGRRPEVTDLTLSVREPTGGPITTESLRGVQVATALKLAVAKATHKVIDNGDGTFSLPGDDSGAVWGASQAPRPVRGTPMSREFLQLVAETYRAAVASGSRSPVEDLSHALGASRSTAGRWVLQARKGGHLGESIGRIAGEQVKKPRRKGTN
jgi:hypothetical protein